MENQSWRGNCRRKKMVNNLCNICKRSPDRCKCVKEALDSVKVGSAEAAAWKKIRMDCEHSIAKNKRDIELLEISMAHAMIREDEETVAFSEEN